MLLPLITTMVLAGIFVLRLPCDLEGIEAPSAFYFLIVAFRGRWAWIMTPLNVLVIVSTVTTGMHDFTDVGVGITVAVLLIGTTRCPFDVLGWARSRRLGPPPRRVGDTSGL